MKSSWLRSREFGWESVGCGGFTLDLSKIERQATQSNKEKEERANGSTCKKCLFFGWEKWKLRGTRTKTGKT